MGKDRYSSEAAGCNCACERGLELVLEGSVFDPFSSFPARDEACVTKKHDEAGKCSTARETEGSTGDESVQSIRGAEMDNGRHAYVSPRRRAATRTKVKKRPPPLSEHFGWEPAGSSREFAVSSVSSLGRSALAANAHPCDECYAFCGLALFLALLVCACGLAAISAHVGLSNAGVRPLLERFGASGGPSLMTGGIERSTVGSSSLAVGGEEDSPPCWIGGMDGVSAISRCWDFADFASGSK